MSSLVFPALRGLTYPVVRRTTYKTLTDEAMSRRTATLALQQYALHEWELPYDYLPDPNGIRQIVGLYNAVRGRWDDFLYTDPSFNTVTGMAFGTGDGQTTAFQIVATFTYQGGPGGPDIIQNFNGLPTIYDNGSLAGSYSLGPSGVVTFATAPVAGHALTWTGSFYYRCKFMDDQLDTHQFMNNFWEIKAVKFRSIVL